ncbi:MAG: hypothetical protein WAR24_23635 [Candidatus Acidiferrales bacterium]
MKTFGFGAEYAVEPADSNDRRLPVVEFGRIEAPISSARSQLLVAPEGGDAWIGSFEAGIGGLTGAFSTPHPRILLVIQKGRAYVIPVDRPEEFVRPPVNPVLQVLPFLDQRRLVLVSHTRLAGLGPEGIEWKTGDLASDGFDEIRPLSDGIYVSAELPSGRRAEYVLDLRDGSLR